jgi:CBS domain-containing protein
MSHLGDVCDLMEDKGIGGLPVVQNSNLKGIITESDILKAIIS